MRSTPKTSAISQQQQLQKSCGTGGDSNSTGLGRKEPAFNSINRVEKYCQFEGQSITMEDYYCLEDESFLNDVIIDFYFKWIQHKILKETTFKENIHIFTTYFYKRYAILVWEWMNDFLFKTENLWYEFFYKWTLKNLQPQFTKDQWNSEWIYEVIISFKVRTIIF